MWVTCPSPTATLESHPHPHYELLVHSKYNCRSIYHQRQWCWQTKPTEHPYKTTILTIHPRFGVAKSQCSVVKNHINHILCGLFFVAKAIAVPWAPWSACPTNPRQRRAHDRWDHRDLSPGFSPMDSMDSINRGWNTRDVGECWGWMGMILGWFLIYVTNYCRIYRMILVYQQNVIDDL